MGLVYLRVDSEWHLHNFSCSLIFLFLFPSHSTSDPPASPIDPIFTTGPESAHLKKYVLSHSPPCCPSHPGHHHLWPGTCQLPNWSACFSLLIVTPLHSIQVILWRCKPKNVILLLRTLDRLPRINKNHHLTKACKTLHDLTLLPAFTFLTCCLPFSKLTPRQPGWSPCPFKGTDEWFYPVLSPSEALWDPEQQSQAEPSGKVAMKCMLPKPSHLAELNYECVCVLRVHTHTRMCSWTT